MPLIGVQIDGNGKLVYWGQDVGGGSNISLIVSPSDEETSGLQITMDPADAAGKGRDNAAGCLTTCNKVTTGAGALL